MDTFVKWKFDELICWTAHFQQLWAHGIVRSRLSRDISSRNGHQGDILPFMKPSSNGNIFRVTGPLCGEFTGHRWIPYTKASNAELWCFLWSAPWINGWVNYREARDLRRHRAHYNVLEMCQWRTCTATLVHSFGLVSTLSTSSPASDSKTVFGEPELGIAKRNRNTPTISKNTLWKTKFLYHRLSLFCIVVEVQMILVESQDVLTNYHQGLFTTIRAIV